MLKFIYPFWRRNNDLWVLIGGQITGNTLCSIFLKVFFGHVNSKVLASIAARSFCSSVFSSGYGGILSKFTHVEAEGKRDASKNVNALSHVNPK